MKSETPLRFGIEQNYWELFFTYEDYFFCLLLWLETVSSILGGDHPLPSRLFGQTVGLHAFQKMVLFEPNDCWGVRQDKYISPFCRQENRNQSSSQEMVRAGAPATYSGHLWVPSFSIPGPWAADSTDRWVRPWRWGRFWQWGRRATPGFSSFRTSECAQAHHQHDLFKTLPDASCG